jgi:polyether ionophore transport system permease protein
VRLFRIALLSHKVGAIAMALIGAVSGLVNAIGYIAIAGHTRPERQVFAKQMEVFGQQLTYLLPAPLQLDTMGGYLTWRAFGSVALLFAIWGVLAGTGAARGDEEKGLTEAWLAAGISRLRWMAARGLGFLAAAGLATAIACAATQLGTIFADDPTPAGAMVAEWLLVLGTALIGFGLGAVVAQFVVTRRVAGALGTAVLIALYVLNSASRAGGDVGVLKWLSPFYLFDRSTPLLEGGAVDVGATIGLFVIPAALIVLAAYAFTLRDIGGPLVRRGTERIHTTFRPSGDPLLRVPVLAIVDQQRLWVAGWALGLAILGYFLTSLVRTMIDGLAAIPTFRVYLQALGISAYSDFVGVIWFGTALFLLAAMCVVQVNGWASDDAEGRLETILAAGASRSRVALERIAALLVDVAIVIGIASSAVWLASRVYDIDVPFDRFVLSTALTLPVAFAFAALGQWLVGWRPRVAVVILGATAVISYFIQQFAPLFSWPEWVGRLSIFGLYGAPMTKIDWAGIGALVAIGVAGTALSLITTQRRDVGT